MSAEQSLCNWVHPTATNMAYSPMNDVSVTVNHTVVMVWSQNVGVTWHSEVAMYGDCA